MANETKNNFDKKVQMHLACSKVACNEIVRRITPTEAARLQTIPEWYKWECSATQQYTMLGNGWTVEVIKHIFSFINR